MEETRRFKFTLQEAQSDKGVVREIGRASKRDASRRAGIDNLFYEERSLSRRHAVLGLKLLQPLEEGNVVNQFRIYVKDLGSTYGIIDLNSKESDPYVVDLKNGERFGLVQLQKPISINQRRAAKLKFEVNVASRGGDVFECLIRDVSFDDSPVVTRPTTFDDKMFFKELESSSLSLSSASELDSERTPCAHEEDTESLCERSYLSETSLNSGMVECIRQDIWSTVSRVQEQMLEHIKQPGEYQPPVSVKRLLAEGEEEEEEEYTSESSESDGMMESIRQDVSNTISRVQQRRLEQWQQPGEHWRPVRAKRPLPEEEGEEEPEKGPEEPEKGPGKPEKKPEDPEKPPRKKAKFNVISKRDIITATVGFALGSFGTIGVLIGIANRLE